MSRILPHRSVIILSTILLSLLLASPLATSYAGSAASPPWPMFRGNPQHSGVSQYAGPSTPSLKWRFSTRGAVSSSPAIGADGTIYVGSFDGGLYAINPDGSPRWRYQTGGHIESSPAIGSDGTVYVGSFDGNLYAINPDGSLKWKFDTGYDAFGSSPAIGSDGSVYFGGGYCCVYALNADGSLKWNFTTDAGINSSPAIGADGTVYVGSYGYSLYAIYPGGTLKWKFTTPGSLYSSPAIGPDGTVYIGTLHSFLNGGDLLALSNGNQKWIFNSINPIESSPVVAPDGMVYLEALDGHMYALNPDGSIKWKSNPGGLSSPVVDADGTIYAVDYGGGLVAVEGRTGGVKWYLALGGNSVSSPSIGSDGTLYVGSNDGNLYAVGSSTTTTLTSSSVTSSSAITSVTSGSSSNTSGCNGFAYTENSTLMLCGRPFNFVGTVDQDILAPYLGFPIGPWVAGVSDTATKMADAAAYGIKVIRFHPELGDFDGMGYVGNGASTACFYCGHAFDSFWQVYSAEPDHRAFFQDMDRMIADARRHGVYVVPSLSICWNCWSSLGNDTDFFQVNSTANLVWKGYLASLASHYRSETQILFWDLTGEGNNVVGGGGYNGNATSPAELGRWVNDTYDFIKKVDPNHLVVGGWNIPWSGFWKYYGGGENAYRKTVSEYQNMTFFRALNAKLDLATLHVYDGDIYNDEQFIGASNLQEALSLFVQHYTSYSRNVLKEPFFIDETGGQLWAFYHQQMSIGYSPSQFIKYLLQDMLKYHVAGANIWGWEEDPGPYYMSPQETPDVANWLKYYSGLLAVTSNQTTSTSLATTTSTTTTQIPEFPALLVPPIFAVVLFSIGTIVRWRFRKILV